MTRSAPILLLVILAFGSIFSQKKAEQTIHPQTIELITPWIFSGPTPTISEERRVKSCFDFASLTHDCSTEPAVRYGDRIGVNWDLFHVDGGKVGRTRMVDIGEFTWTDKFTVPNVEPWSALAPGETRTISINASGGNGAAGAPGRRGEDGVAGMNGDGTYTAVPRPRQPDTVPQPVRTGSKNYAMADVREQVSSSVKGTNGKVRKDPYSPVVEVKKDHMYVVRVVDETRDFYVLLHVDELVRGERVVLSFVKIEPVIL